MDIRFAKHHKIPIHSSEAKGEAIKMANGSEADCSGEVQDISVQIENYKSHPQDFDLTTLERYDVILGKPWLWEEDPIISHR